MDNRLPEVKLKNFCLLGTLEVFEGLDDWQDCLKLVSFVSDATKVKILG